MTLEANPSLKRLRASATFMRGKGMKRDAWAVSWVHGSLSFGFGPGIYLDSKRKVFGSLIWILFGCDM